MRPQQLCPSRCQTNQDLLRLAGLGLLLLGMAWLLRPASRPPAGKTVSQPFEGVRVVHLVLDTPRRIDLHLVLLDLRNPHLRFEVIGDGEPGRDHRETTQRVVHRLGAQIGINGGFFDNFGIPISLCASNGRRVAPWHPTERNHNNGVNISRDNQVTFLDRAAQDSDGFATDPPVALYNALSGNVRLLREGKFAARRGGDPTYPQTALGVTADQHLILLVADGRRPEISTGMTYEEVANLLQRFGAVDAIALDGGGSATLVLADTVHSAPQVVNHPSDGRERVVGNHLAVFITPEPKR